MRRRTYKSRREKLFRDELPQDGQKIAYRGYAQKTYFHGVWNAGKRCVVIHGGEEIGIASVRVFGWYPRPDITEEKSP